jgi:uncharacterized secreted protein with C-terminal beta-propeller domain
MKKRIITIILVISLLAMSLVGCGKAEQEQAKSGYAIIHHYDGDEYVEFSDYEIHSYGVFTIYANDGRIIMGSDMILIFE